MVDRWKNVQLSQWDVVEKSTMNFEEYHFRFKPELNTFLFLRRSLLCVEFDDGHVIERFPVDQCFSHFVAIFLDFVRKLNDEISVSDIFQNQLIFEFFIFYHFEKKIKIWARITNKPDLDNSHISFYFYRKLDFCKIIVIIWYN